MKKILFAYMISLMLFSQQCFSNGFLEVREAWNSASKEHQFKLGAGYNFQNGAGVLYQTIFNTGKNLDQLKHGFDELEGWYPVWKITNDLTFYGGGLVNSSSRGSIVAPYFQFGYIASENLALAFKYRYNNTNYITRDLNGQMDNDNSHQLIFVANYKINDHFSYEFEPDLFFNVNDYHRGNGKDHAWELNHKLTWKINDIWRPFVQLSWLDRDIANNTEIWRIRLGIRYYF